MTSNDDKVFSVFQRVLGLPLDVLSDQTRRQHLEVWDSLSHMLIIEALRQEFRVKIPPEKALEMDSIGDIKRLVAELQARDGR